MLAVIILIIPAKLTAEHSSLNEFDIKHVTNKFNIKHDFI